MKILKSISGFFRSIATLMRGRASSTLEQEVIELEHVFSLLTLSAFIGLPAPPLNITLDLLADMEKNLILLINKIETANAPISELFSTMDVG